MDTTFDIDGQNADIPKPRSSRRKRKRKTVLGLGPRLFLVAAAIIVTLIALGEFALKIVQPYQMQHAEARQIAHANAQLAAYRAANEDLQSKIDYLKRPDGIENAARSQDWVKRGEISLEVTVAPAPVVAHEQSGFAGMIRRAWQNLTARS